jgi:hypothetical protein
MASIYEEIRGALELKLSTVAGIPSIAYENVSFTPTTGQAFVQPRFIPVSRRPAARGLNPPIRYDGVLRVFCYAPEGEGPSAADLLANKVIEAFEATTDIAFTKGGKTIHVSIDYAERDNGFVETPWYYVAVNIGWYIYT